MGDLLRRFLPRKCCLSFIKFPACNLFIFPSIVLQLHILKNSRRIFIYKTNNLVFAFIFRCLVLSGRVPAIRFAFLDELRPLPASDHNGHHCHIANILSLSVECQGLRGKKLRNRGKTYLWGAPEATTFLSISVTVVHSRRPLLEWEKRTIKRNFFWKKKKLANMSHHKWQSYIQKMR